MSETLSHPAGVGDPSPQSEHAPEVRDAMRQVGAEHSQPTKTRLVQKIVTAFNAAPDRVHFPKGDSR